MGSIPGLFFQMQGGFWRLFQPLSEYYRSVDSAGGALPRARRVGYRMRIVGFEASPQQG